jgi:hypothetical protein
LVFFLAGPFCTRDKTWGVCGFYRPNGHHGFRTVSAAAGETGVVGLQSPHVVRRLLGPFFATEHMSTNQTRNKLVSTQGRAHLLHELNAVNQ